MLPLCRIVFSPSACYSLSKKLFLWEGGRCFREIFGEGNVYNKQVSVNKCLCFYLEAVCKLCYSFVMSMYRREEEKLLAGLIFKNVRINICWEERTEENAYLCVKEFYIEMQKVFITRYALTGVIYEAYMEVFLDEPVRCYGKLGSSESHTFFQHDFKLTLEEALEDAEKRRREEIKNLKQKIEKYENLEIVIGLR